MLKKWARALPPGKDQIFLPARFPLMATHGLSVEKIPPREHRKNWGLLERSWFAYLANHADFRIILPPGKVERLPPGQQLALQKIQVKMKNPAVVPSRLLPVGARGPGGYTWLTAEFFRRLHTKEKIAALEAWSKAGKLTGIYSHVSPSSLPAKPKKLLKARRLLNLVNSFPSESGPNCFAAAAYAITGKYLHEWMHAEPFLKIARRAGYRPASGRPQPGDILVCRRKEEAVHAALYLGGFVFEKPGQDLYEPYRIARWKNWQKDWRHTRFEIWRASIDISSNGL